MHVREGTYLCKSGTGFLELSSRKHGRSPTSTVGLNQMRRAWTRHARPRCIAVCMHILPLYLAVGIVRGKIIAGSNADVKKLPVQLCHVPAGRSIDKRISGM